MKCVPANYSVQKPSSTVPLHNKFQCLQDLSDSQDNGIHDEIHTIKVFQFILIHQYFPTLTV